MASMDMLCLVSLSKNTMLGVTALKQQSGLMSCSLCQPVFQELSMNYFTFYS